jgi:hypothetical protein
MGKKYTKFVTETGSTVEIDEDIELTERLTGQVIVASRATPDLAVVIPARLVGASYDVQALRCEHEYARRQHAPHRGLSGPVRRVYYGQ